MPFLYEINYKEDKCCQTIKRNKGQYNMGETFANPA